MYHTLMVWMNIPRTHCFSLGDFHDFDSCVFRFFVNHHLGKKYELAEGSPGQAVGSLLDLAIKKLHSSKAYDQPIEYLQNLVKAAEAEIRSEVEKKGKNSFYGAQLDFLTPEVAEKAKAVFKNYHQGISGQYRKMVSTPTTRKLKPFWEYVVAGQELLKIWGGPDSIEMGSDSLPEVVDYKYLQKGDESTAYLDMDLMPKVYTLLSAKELSDLGYQKIRFAVRLWHNPGNDSYYEEFDVSSMKNLEDFFKDKMERILRTGELSFCERDYCKACKSDKRREWIKELQKQGWIKD